MLYGVALKTAGEEEDDVEGQEKEEGEDDLDSIPELSNKSVKHC